jgi:hypothetical protein
MKSRSSVIGAVILLALYRTFARRNGAVTHRTDTNRTVTH